MYNSLNVLKGIVAINIALGHYLYWGGHGDKYPLSFMLGVEFFFILSGFLLTKSLYSRLNFTNYEYIKYIVKARISRLYIPYLILGSIWCILYGFPNLYTSTVIFTLTQMLGFENGGEIFIDSIFGISWCLSLELWIGIIFFTILFYNKEKIKKIICILPIIISSTLLILIRYSPNYMDIHYYRLLDIIPMGIFRVVLGYSLGVIIYLISKELSQNNKYNKFNMIIYSLFEITSIIFIMYFYGKTNYNRMNEFVFPIYISILILIFSQEKGIISNIMKFKYIKWIGNLSFSIYLIHPFIIRIFKDINMRININSILIFLVTLILVSYVNYNTIENVGNKMKNRIC